MNAKKHISFIVLRIISLLPILAWPFVFFGSIFMFDDPNANLNLRWLLFILINGYPVILILNLLLANWCYNRNLYVSYALVSWPILLFAWLAFLIVF